MLRLYLTDIDGEFECDAFFPDLTAFGIAHITNERLEYGYVFNDHLLISDFFYHKLSRGQIL